MGKNWLQNKKAVLAIFYCGLQSVKSFHIPRRSIKDGKYKNNYRRIQTILR